MADFGPRITIKIVESLRDDIYSGKLKSGSEIKVTALILFFESFRDTVPFTQHPNLVTFSCAL